jgi:hypothetical protein
MPKEINRESPDSFRAFLFLHNSMLIKIRPKSLSLWRGKGEAIEVG